MYISIYIYICFEICLPTYRQYYIHCSGTPFATMTDTPQDLRDKIRTLLRPLNAGGVSSDIRPRQSSRSRSPRAQGKDYAAGKSSRQQHQDFTEAELSGDQNNHGFRRLPRFPWVQDPNRAPKQRAPALDTPHRDELKRPPTVRVDGPDCKRGSGLLTAVQFLHAA